MAILEKALIFPILERIANALEKGNDISERRMLLDYPLATRPEPKHFSISRPTVDDWNKRNATGQK